MNRLGFLLFTGLLFLGCDKPECEKGKREANCICTANYDPVCGCDEITYSNSCEAECHGITKYTKGECK